MSNESVKRKLSKYTWVSILIMVIVLPLLMLTAKYLGNRKYYLFSVMIIFLSMLPFYLSFEKRKPQAREIVTLSVMSAIAVASRAAFIMVPHFKPMTGIIMITSIAFGPEAGFLVGAVSSFVSNFIFGQGPWTPWQMFAYGLAGFLAGIWAKVRKTDGDKNLSSAIFGAVVVICLVGPILDTSTLFTMAETITRDFAVSVYLSGLPVNIIHGIATFLTVLFLCKPITEKLNRIKIKYGMMEEDEA